MSALETPYVVTVGSDGGNVDPPVHELIGGSGAVGTTLTADASPNTKGEWIELGTTTFDADGFYVQFVPGDEDQDYLYDIGIGADGAEVALVENMYGGCFSLGNFWGPTIFYVPLPVTSGTRITGRLQSDVGSLTSWLSVIMAAGPDYHRIRKTTATTYGANTATTRGTSIDPGTSANQNGNWIELDAAVDGDITYAVAFTGPGGNQARATASWMVELGIGAAAAETTNFPGMQVRVHSTDDGVLPQAHEARAAWTAGSRLTARARCSITTAGDRLIHVVVVGFG